MSRQIFSKDELTQEELKDAKASYDFKARMTPRRKDRTGLQLEMRLTFDEWLDTWLASGKLLMRGRAKGDYCMSRKDDLGHYEVGNVFIQLTAENGRQGRSVIGHSEEVKAKMSETRKGKPNGKKGKKHEAPAWNKGKKSDRPAWNKGVSPSAEALEKQRLAQTGVKQALATCPHCQKEGGKGLMTRYHFDNCKTLKSGVANDPNFRSAA